MSSYVYVITHVPTGRHYVGKSNNPASRWSKHKSVASAGGSSVHRFHRALHKYGADQFTFQVVESFDTERDAYEAESFWIEFLRSNIEGFNLDSGGTGGTIRSAETKAKLSLFNKGKRLTPEHCLKISMSARGRKRAPFSKEARSNMSRSGKQKVFSAEHRANISEAQKRRWAQRASV